MYFINLWQLEQFRYLCWCKHHVHGSCKQEFILIV